MEYKVITAVASEPVTLDEARLQCKVDADDTSEDSLIEVWISQARELAEHYTGSALAPQTLEAAADEFPRCREAFRLPRPPVSSVTSLKYTDTAGVEQTLDAAAYALSPYGNQRAVAPAFGNQWPSAARIPDAVRVRYQTGYATAPKVVKAAILLMVAWMYEHRGDEMSANDIQPPNAKALLDSVRVWG